jgi:glycosyltransferase involved in cell wall biosynthesis
VSTVLFAAERLLPARGGAERYALELLDALASRGHEVRALWLAEGTVAGAPAAGGRGPSRPSVGRAPVGTAGGSAAIELPPGVSGTTVRAPVAGGYWADKAARRAAVCEAVTAALAAAPADVVITQLHAAPGAVDAAGGTPTVLLLPSYASLCRYAFDAGSTCGPHRDCVRCPRARSLPDAESAHLRAGRSAHERSLAGASALLAPSAAVAEAVERWCGRRPTVVPGAAAEVVVAHAPRPTGHVVLAAGAWSAEKGADLLIPLIAALPEREFLVTPAGLGADEMRAVGATGNVWFLDAPIERILDGAAVCLVPSRRPEPFSRIALEAQSAGVPVLASAVGALPELVPEAALLPAGAGAEEWAVAVRALETPDAWAEAHRRALAAAAAIVATLPLARAAEVVEAVALAGGG